MNKGETMKKIKRIIDIILIIALLVLMLSLSIYANAETNNAFVEPVKIRCTCYCDTGVTASGVYTRPGIMASKPEYIGYVACVNAVNEDGSIGEFIGYYEILDTGYGAETGVGQSKIFKNRTLGTIESFQTIDIYQPTMHQAEEWVEKYNDYVYIKIIKGVG